MIQSIVLARRQLVLHVVLAIRLAARRRRIDILLLFDAVGTVFVARHIHVSPHAWGGPRDFILDAERVNTADDSEVTHLAPVLTPGVTYHPVLGAVFSGAPSDDGDDVVDFKVGGVRVNAANVASKTICVDTGRNRTSSVNFSHDGVFTGNHAVFGNRGVRESTQSAAETAKLGKRAARAARVHRGARVITAASAVALRRLGAAGFVRQAGVERNESSIVNELIRARVTTAVARSRNLRSAVQNVLNREIHILSSVLTARNLNAIRERAHRTVGPARPTILRNVLVERLAQKVVTLHVAPHERFRQRISLDVLVRLRGQNNRALIVPWHDFVLVETLRWRVTEVHSRRENLERLFELVDR